MDELCDDLTAEHEDLDRLVDVDVLAFPTPAPPWTIGDQISHLWFFDQRALLAMTDPDGFVRDTDVILAAVSGGGEDPAIAQGRAVTSEQLLAGWRTDRQLLVDHARTVDPRARIPWYGPAMSARSFITARLMETWAHGQDVADAVGVQRTPTDRLRHVAHIGVGARAFSYVANNREPNPTPIRVELVGPSGDTWTWGPEDAADRVTGPALGFGLLVTQRRHRDDAGLTVEGAAADEWLDIAQSFAGPPGPGRQPGQFA